MKHSPITPRQDCRSCEGEGTVFIEPLDAREGYAAICDDCEGTGKSREPYCETCDGKLTVDGFCYSCDDYAEGFPERIAPLPSGWNRIAL